MKNLIIAIEGVDSVGKETQAKLIQQWLSGTYTVQMQSFPNYNTPSGQLVRSYLNGEYGPASGIHAELASSLYALDRAACRSALVDFLKGNGKLLILDRYVHSNVAFQGGKYTTDAQRLAFCHRMTELEFDHVGMPRPDLILFLDADPTAARALMAKRKQGDAVQVKDQHESNQNLLTDAYNTYKLIAEVVPNWETVPCMRDGLMRSIDAIHMDIRSIIKNKLLNG